MSEDSGSSGPVRQKNAPEMSSTQSSSRDSYVPYEREKNPEKKSSTLKAVAAWLAVFGSIVLVTTVAQKFSSHPSAQPAAAVAKSNSSSPLAAMAPAMQQQLLVDFNRYIELTEKPSSEALAQDPSAKPDPAAALLKPEVQQADTKVKTSVAAFATADPNFVSLVAKCFIEGHDIHFITPDGKILSHVPEGTVLPAMLSRAREVILSNPKGETRVFVFKDKLQIVDVNGKLVAEEPVK